MRLPLTVPPTTEHHALLSTLFLPCVVFQQKILGNPPPRKPVCKHLSLHLGWLCGRSLPPLPILKAVTDHWLPLPSPASSTPESCLPEGC